MGRYGKSVVKSVQKSDRLKETFWTKDTVQIRKKLWKIRQMWLKGYMEMIFHLMC